MLGAGAEPVVAMEISPQRRRAGLIGSAVQESMKVALATAVIALLAWPDQSAGEVLSAGSGFAALSTFIVVFAVATAVQQRLWSRCRVEVDERRLTIVNRFGTVHFEVGRCALGEDRLPSAPALSALTVSSGQQHSRFRLRPLDRRGWIARDAISSEAVSFDDFLIALRDHPEIRDAMRRVYPNHPRSEE